MQWPLFTINDIPPMRITFRSLKLVLKKGFEFAPSLAWGSLKDYQIRKSDFDPVRGRELGLNFISI